MARPSHRLILTAIGVIVVMLVGVTIWLLTSFFGEETIPEQTSPDGSWSVTIRGTRTIFGSIEVTCQKRAASSTASSWHVVGMVSSWDEFRSKYARITFAGDMAVANGEGFTLRPGVTKWPIP